MITILKKSLQEWNQSTTERAKLQHSYITIAVTSIVIAGLVGLVDYDLGQRIVAFALICIGIFLINAVAWALLSGLLLVRLNGVLPTKRTVKTPRPTTKKTK